VEHPNINCERVEPISEGCSPVEDDEEKSRKIGDKESLHTTQSSWLMPHISLSLSADNSGVIGVFSLSCGAGTEKRVVVEEEGESEG
jgi:hypothetical protein